MELTARQAAILRAVCRHYVVSGREVASKTLAKGHGFDCSAATLRQELASLERMGLVCRPHRSAGCTPTHAGLECYAAGLVPGGGRPNATVASAVDRSLRDLRGGHRVGMKAAVCVLSEVSGCLAVSFVGGDSPGVIDDVDVVPLVGERLLVVLTMREGATHVQPVELPLDGADALEVGLELAGEPGKTPASPQADGPAPAAEDLRARLRELCRGRTLAAARDVAIARLQEQEARADRLLARALRVGIAVCGGEGGSAAAVAVLDPLLLELAGGQRLAGGLPDTERISEVLALLEDHQRLAAVLCQLVGEAGTVGETQANVHVGTHALLDPSGATEAASAAPAGPTLTLVGCPVPVVGAGEAAGTNARGCVALIGPDRMDYATVIPLVEYAARALAATIHA